MISCSDLIQFFPAVQKITNKETLEADKYITENETVAVLDEVPSNTEPTQAFIENDSD